MVRALLASMKEDKIPLPFVGGSLIPIGHPSKFLANVLYEARIREAHTFPYRGTVTLETTQRWLREKIVGDPSTILFRVCGPHTQLIGILGYTDCLGDKGFQIYDVLRLAHGSCPGIMTKAMRAALQWAYDTARAPTIWLVTKVDNEKAIRFYRRVGCVPEQEYPVIHAADGSYARLPDGDDQTPTGFLLRMRHVRNGGEHE